MKSAFVLLALFIGGAWWAADVGTYSSDKRVERKTYLDLDDETLDRRLKDAEREWKRVAGSVTNMDVPYRTDKELMSYHDEYRALKDESDARKTRGH